MATRITFFEVPPDADAAFRAAWARDGAGTLWRALRDDAAYRFLALADAGEGPDLHELVAEDGRPDVAGGVLLVRPRGAPEDEDLSAHRGYLGRLVYRDVERDERLVLERWSSPLMIQRAGREGTVYGSSSS